MVKVNGNQTDYDGKTISEILDILKYEPKRVAVELNENILPKAEYGDTVIKRRRYSRDSQLCRRRLICCLKRKYILHSKKDMAKIFRKNSLPHLLQYADLADLARISP